MTPTAWDARAQVHLATLIRRYLAENPPPAQSLLADDLDEFARRLDDDGHARLQAAGEQRLTVLP